MGTAQQSSTPADLINSLRPRAPCAGCSDERSRRCGGRASGICSSFVIERYLPTCSPTVLHAGPLTNRKALLALACHAFTCNGDTRAVMVMTLGSPTGQASTSRPAQAAHHAAPCSRSGRSSRPWRRASGLVAAPGGCAQARRQPPRTLVAASAADVDSAALVPLGEEAKPAPRRPGYRSFVLVRGTQLKARLQGA